MPPICSQSFNIGQCFRFALVDRTCRCRPRKFSNTRKYHDMQFYDQDDLGSLPYETDQTALREMYPRSKGPHQIYCPMRLAVTGCLPSAVAISSIMDYSWHSRQMNSRLAEST